MKKALLLLGFLLVSETGFAATARVSIAANAGARMPTMTARINGTATNTTSSTTGTGGILADPECITAYSDCLRGGDVCGPNFEECTTKTLFYAKKPLCASTLMQCSNAGVNSLFGTSNQTAFANKNTAGEFVYPTDGSVLGQLIEAAHISNRYDTQTCVRRYTSCLKRDDVCGADFELCTTNTEFKKQKLFCESTLARCENDGVKELFGTTTSTANPTADSRLGIMISEGAALAAVNAVATCYKVADQCIINTCARNPYKCKEGTDRAVASIVDIIDAASGEVTAQEITYGADAINRSDISAFLKNSCFDTIAGSKYCYATFLGNGVMPTAAQLRDEDNREEIFSEAYSSRMNTTMHGRIDELIEKFKTKTMQSCQSTITSCAMRNCGGGSGLACYNIAASGEAANPTVDITLAASGIKAGCEAVVNNDNYCKYSRMAFDAATGGITYQDTSLFDTLFTKPSTTDTGMDPVGAVAALNLKLSQSFSIGGMNQMTKQCENSAKSCVRSMCGTDYANCYRNRTDIMSGITSTDNTSFDNSMNKVNGVLDRTIIVGLCMETLKSNPTCEELIKAKAYAANTAITTGGAVWGDSTTVGNAWLNTGTYSVKNAEGSYQDQDANGNQLCTASMANCGVSVGVCNTTFETGGTTCTYDTPAMVDAMTYATNLAESQIFQDAVRDLEIEAQAKYNAKLTNQMHQCVSGNNGGIVGSRDVNSGMYAWVKLRQNKVPANYAVKGLAVNQFVESNDLYGSFCRIRVTLQSDDKDIQDAISSGKDWSTAYFAAGDAFTCGSWIPQSELSAIANTVAERKTGTNADGSLSTGQKWGVAGTSLLGMIGGGIGMNALQNGSLGGLLGTNTKQQRTTDNAAKVKCETDFISAKQGLTSPCVRVASYITSPQDQTRLAVFEGRPKALQTAPTQTETCPVGYTDISAGDAATKLGVDMSKYNDVDAFCGTQEKDPDSKWGTKQWVNVAGGGIGAAILGIGTTQIMKASNRSEFNAEQQAWMDEVGQHIRCFIGPDEVGIFSDIISTEMN